MAAFPSYSEWYLAHPELGAKRTALDYMWQALPAHFGITNPSPFPYIPQPDIFNDLMRGKQIADVITQRRGMAWKDTFRYLDTGAAAARAARPVPPDVAAPTRAQPTGVSPPYTPRPLHPVSTTSTTPGSGPLLPPLTVLGDAEPPTKSVFAIKSGNVVGPFKTVLG